MPQLLRPDVRTARKRAGKGFSAAELAAAGLTVQAALQLGLAIDRRRKSVWDENVAVLQYLKAEAEKK